MNVKKVLRVALCFQQITTDGHALLTTAVLFFYLLTYNSCGLMPRWTKGRVNVWTYSLLETRMSPRGESKAGSQCGNIISDSNFLKVFQSHRGSILLSFLDMTNDHGTDSRWWTDWHWQALHSLKQGQQQIVHGIVNVSPCPSEFNGTNPTPVPVYPESFVTTVLFSRSP